MLKRSTSGQMKEYVTFPPINMEPDRGGPGKKHVPCKGGNQAPCKTGRRGKFRQKEIRHPFAIRQVAASLCCSRCHRARAWALRFPFAQTSPSSDGRALIPELPRKSRKNLRKPSTGLLVFVGFPSGLPWAQACPTPHTWHMSGPPNLNWQLTLPFCTSNNTPSHSGPKGQLRAWLVKTAHLRT